MTQQVKMPEPAIQVDFDENGDAYIFAKATDEPIAKLTALGEGVCDVGQGFLTTTQAEAYADARVREALEKAAQICWEMQSSPEFGKDDKDHWLAIAERRIRSLIPPTE